MEQKPTRFFFIDRDPPEPEKTYLIKQGNAYLSELKNLQESGVPKDIWHRNRENNTIQYRFDTSGPIDNVYIKTFPAAGKKEKRKRTVRTESILPCIELVTDSGEHNGFYVMDKNFNPWIRRKRSDKYTYSGLDSEWRNVEGQALNGYVGEDTPDGSGIIGTKRYTIKSLNQDNKRIVNDYSANDFYLVTDPPLIGAPSYWDDINDINDYLIDESQLTHLYLVFSYSAEWTAIGPPLCGYFMSRELMGVGDMWRADSQTYADIMRSTYADLNLADYDEDGNYTGVFGDPCESGSSTQDKHTRYYKFLVHSGNFFATYQPTVATYEIYNISSFHGKEAYTQDYAGDGACWEGDYYLYIRTQRDHTHNGTGITFVSPWITSGSSCIATTERLSNHSFLDSEPFEDYFPDYPTEAEWLANNWDPPETARAWYGDFNTSEDSDVYGWFLNCSGEVINMFPNGLESGGEIDYYNGVQLGISCRIYNADKESPAYCVSYFYGELIVGDYSNPSCRFWFKHGDLVIGAFGEDDIKWGSNNHSSSFSGTRRSSHDSSCVLWDVENRDGSLKEENGAGLYTYGYMRAVKVITEEEIEINE